MAVKPLSDRGRQIVLLLANAAGPVAADEIARCLPKLGAVANDLAELVAGGTLEAQGLMNEAQLKAELEHVWPYLVQAQRTGAEFRWKSQNTFVYRLSKVGRDMVPLLRAAR
jgi:hypothetical protein